MGVLITTKKGFINASVEPQFQHGSGAMVTIQLSEHDDVRNLTRYLKGDVLFDQHDKLFPFTSFIHLDDLVREFKQKKIWSRLDETKVDFSKPPVAYYWEAYYTVGHEEYGDLVDDGTYFSYELPEDIADARWGFDLYPDVFHVYPLYTMPRELVKEPLAHPEYL